ncbi:MAG: aminopeptidase P family protein, partial [Crocosphaera sp.]
MLDIQFLQNRRKKLAQLINFPTVLWSGKAPARNFRANYYPFRASSHFLYFTGLPIENAAIRLENGNLELFMDNPHPDSTLWHGEMPTREKLALQIGADNAYPIKALKDKMAQVATIPVQDSFTYQQQQELLQRSLLINEESQETDQQLIKAIITLRLTHDHMALEEIKEAVNIAIAAHKRGLKSTKKSETEAQVRAEMESYIIGKNMTCAYNSIVTVNGEVLHNETYNNELKSGDLLLADVGAETVLGWASDITRTWPVNGRFSSSQRDIYDNILAAQTSCIKSIKTGKEYREIH